MPEQLGTSRLTAPEPGVISHGLDAAFGNPDLVDRVHFEAALSERDAWKERAQAAEQALLDIMNRVDDVLSAEYRV